MEALDDSSFARLYRVNRATVHRAARQVLGDDAAAEDVTQDVFLTLWRDPARFDPARSPLPAYLTLLARSRALDLWRSRRTVSRALERWGLLAAGEAKLAEDSHEQVEREERRRRIRAALADLPPDQREAIVLSYWAAMRSHEIARRTRVPAATARSRVRLGLAKLEPRLGEEREPAA